MKVFFWLLAFLFLLIGSYALFLKVTPLPLNLEKEPKTVIKDSFEGLSRVSFQGQNFLFLAEKITNSQSLSLWPNFEERKSAQSLFEEKKCRFLVNGGFYDEKNEPLGWFFTQERLWHSQIKSALFNGFFSQDKDGLVKIEDVRPSTPVFWGLQTGPILIFEGQPLNIKMVKDEKARRLVAALNQKSELFFLVVIGPDSLLSGPLLADLPQIISSIGQNLNENFQTAINLDGGMASAFISKEKSLKEYNPIGSFFCWF